MPLRERREDIPLLAAHFVQGKAASSSASWTDRGRARRLMQYDWPGNVRELENVIERAAILRVTPGCGSTCRRRERRDQRSRRRPTGC